ncbi:MAG: PH domain-containing protein, partial [Dehalococcoidales bacterium]
RWFGIAIMALSLLAFLVRSLKWWSTVYGITNKRILVKTGVVGRSYIDCSLGKIHNLQVKVPVHGRLLGFGSVSIIVSASSSTEILWENVRDPLRVQRELNEAVERFTQDGYETPKVK